MLNQKTLSRFVALLLLCLLTLSACGSSTGANKPGPRPLSAVETLNNTANLLQKVKSAHVSNNDAVETNSVSAHQDISVFNSSTTTTVEGDEVRTGASSNYKANFETNSAGGTTTIYSEIMTNNQMYLKPQADSSWVALNQTQADTLNTVPEFRLNGFDEAKKFLADGLKGKLVDMGVEPFEDRMAVHHFQATFDEKSLFQDPENNFQFADAIKAVQRFQGKNIQKVEDIMIDTHNSELYTIEEKVSFQVDAKKLTLPKGASNADRPALVEFTFSKTIVLDNLNESVTITAPANAVTNSNL